MREELLSVAYSIYEFISNQLFMLFISVMMGFSIELLIGRYIGISLAHFNDEFALMMFVILSLSIRLILMTMEFRAAMTESEE